MLRKLVAVILIVLALLTLASCSENESTTEFSRGIITVPYYITSLNTEKTAHLTSQTNLLLHPLKEAIKQYGDDYELTWEGNYVKIAYKEAKCAFEAYAGSEFEHYDWYNNYISFDDCDIMEYLSYAVIERVVFDVEGMSFADGISVGMSVNQIAEKLNVDGIDLNASNPTITTEYDNNGNKLDVYTILCTISDIDCIVVFKGGTLSCVELANYNRYLTDEDSSGDNGEKMITEAFSYLSKNKLAKFDAESLSYKGKIYSSYYDSWFYGWQFTKGDYEGCVINVEQKKPYRIYVAAAVDNQPILFWSNGKYVDPVLSFLGKWREYNSQEYIDIKSISEDGIVVFDMFVHTSSDTDEMLLLKNLNTVVTETPKNLDAYLFDKYGYDGLGGNVQFFDGKVQSGYFTYAGDKFYLSDAFYISMQGYVEYLPTGLTGRVGAGPLPIHIPGENYKYTQPSSCGYMENFGRDDSNKDNVISTKKSAGEAVIDAYLNDLYKTSGFEYANIEYRYLYNYVFPLNNITYNVWECIETETPHYLYVDSKNKLIIKETKFNAVSKHTKELIYKSDMIVSSESYANQKYLSLDGEIIVDLANKTITKNDSFVKDIKLLDVIYENLGDKDRFMFFANIGERFTLNGYVLFHHTTWGATLHITDSNVPGFDIGVYYLNSEKFFIDPTVSVVGVPEKSDKDKYLDDNVDEINKETKLVIREVSGKIIGYIYVDDDGKKTVKNFSGKILGYYYPDRNVTTDFSGKILARGDISSALLFKK